MKRTVLVLALVACGAERGPNAPAATGVRAYLAALKSNDPHDAYDMLSSDAKHKVSYDEFKLQWKQSEAERKWQAKVLEDSLKGNPDVGERALVSFSDGKLVQLEREGKVWRLESELVSRSRAKQPQDAIRLFASAIAARDVAGALNVLTQRRRDGLTKQIEGFISGLGKRVNDHLDRFGTDRAELRWDRTASASASCFARKTTSGASTTSTSAPRPRKKRPRRATSKARSPIRSSASSRCGELSTSRGKPCRHAWPC